MTKPQTTSGKSFITTAGKSIFIKDIPNKESDITINDMDK